jgi:hypothetical protein
VEKVYVYTEKGESHALARGLTTRKAGEPATFAGKPLGGGIGKAWLQKGYVKEVDNDDERRN